MCVYVWLREREKEREGEGRKEGRDKWKLWEQKIVLEKIIEKGRKKERIICEEYNNCVCVRDSVWECVKEFVCEYVWVWVWVCKCECKCKCECVCVCVCVWERERERALNTVQCGKGKTMTQ